MFSDFMVCRAEARHLEQAAGLFDAYRQFYGAASNRAASREFLAARSARGESLVLLAFPRDVSDAAPVGFAQLYRSFSSVQVAPIVILNDLFVPAEWRSHGVGRALLEASARCAGESGAIRVELTTKRSNSGAIKLYHSFGFRADYEFVSMQLDVNARMA